MAVSTAFAPAKLETLLLSNTTSSPSSPAQIGLFCKPARAASASASSRAFQIQRRFSFTPPSIRCEVASDALLEISHEVDFANAASSSASAASSLSALQQLKTSAADRNILLPSSLFCAFQIHLWVSCQRSSFLVDFVWVWSQWILLWFLENKNASISLMVHNSLAHYLRLEDFSFERHVRMEFLS